MNPTKNSTRYIVLVLAVTFLIAASVPMAAQVTTKTFAIVPVPTVESCLAASPSVTPTVTIQVTHGNLDDVMTVVGDHFLPNLNFDLFTVQRTNLSTTGTVDPSFKSFGLAWFQSKLHSDESGHISATVRSAILDRNFGFDRDVALGPTHTYHIGFWFDRPQDAAACGFDVSKPTPFNATHNAGPAAMISRPDAISKLGPLCANPDGSGGCTP